MKPKILYHGSMHKINDFIDPRYFQDLSIYVTDRIECAKGMSLTGEQAAFANYSEENFRVVFLSGSPSEKTRYVYEVSSESFEEGLASHEWISKSKVPILKRHEYSTDELRNYWRMATPEEIKEKSDKIAKGNAGVF